MSEAVELVLYDRSRTVADWHCRRARYLGYEWGGRGIVPDNTSLELHMGTVLHDALASIASEWQVAGVADIEAIASAARKAMFDSLMQLATDENSYEGRQFAHEQAALVEGLLRGFYRYMWPLLMKQFKRIVLVEGESLLQHGKRLGFMSKPDLLAEDFEGNWWYVEYKSTSSKKSSWVNSWATAIQLHSAIRAAEATTGHPIVGVVVQGLYKGYESYGKQNSPFCYAYVKEAAPPFTSERVEYEYRAGYKRQATWERPGGVRAWVEGMPENMLADQFPQAPPIFIKNDMLDAFFRQREYREEEIRTARDKIATAAAEERFEDVDILLDIHFAQSFDKCVPAWGRPCGFRHICHGQVSNPLEQGFTWRQPHHDPEAGGEGF